MLIPVQKVRDYLTTNLEPSNEPYPPSDYHPSSVSPCMRHSMLLGTLLFDLGPAMLLFHHTYLEYLRAANDNGARRTRLCSLRSKTTGGLVRLVAGLAALHLLVCLCAPKIRNAGTQPCFRNPPLSHGYAQILPSPLGHINLLCVYPQDNVDATVANSPGRIYRASVLRLPTMSFYGRSKRNYPST